MPTAPLSFTDPAGRVDTEAVPPVPTGAVRPKPPAVSLPRPPASRLVVPATLTDAPVAAIEAVPPLPPPPCIAGELPDPPKPRASAWKLPEIAMDPPALAA